MANFTLRLVEADMLYDSCRHMVFARTDGEPLHYIPGQFIQIHFQHKGQELKRSYSVGTPNHKGKHDRLEIAVSYVDGGPATALLSNMQLGDEVEASGPYGRFVLVEELPKRCFLMATGTGVTPYRAMLPTFTSMMPDTEFHVVFGARTQDELLYRREFEQMAEAHEHFHYRPCLSREDIPAALSNGFKGYVQEALAEQLPNPETDIVYLCGNPDMVDDTFRFLKEKEFPVSAIKREKYVSPRLLPPRRTLPIA